MSEQPTEKAGEKPEAVGPAPGLYLVATPIGNLSDMTLRALDVLARADLIVCEDTRVSGKLLKAYDIDTRMMSYNDHNAESRRGAVLETLAQGGTVALISDAGMPLISDPGFKLVRDCLDLGLPVTSVPGANAVLSALQLSGLPGDKFSFIGFLPQKEKARRDVLEEWKDVKGSVIAFETAPRLLSALRDIEKVMGARTLAVVREMTKIHEAVKRGPASELIAFYEETGAPKGEIVLVIGPAADKVYTDDELEEMLRDVLATTSTKEAAAAVAKKTGAQKKKLYEMALRISGE